jgi:DNA-binding response OmpR family regulator
MVTTEGRDADRDRAIALGASGYVVKPFTAASLLAALRPFRAAA